MAVTPILERELCWWNGNYAAAPLPLSAERYSLKSAGTLLSPIRPQSTARALTPLSDVMTFPADGA